MSNKIKMNVEMKVTEAQALTLQAMFEEWNHLGSIGSSRSVSFFVDGDGDFKPNCKIKFSKKITSLNYKLRKLMRHTNGKCDINYDFANVAWSLNKL